MYLKKRKQEENHWIRVFKWSQLFFILFTEYKIKAKRPTNKFYKGLKRSAKIKKEKTEIKLVFRFNPLHKWSYGWDSLLTPSWKENDCFRLWKKNKAAAHSKQQEINFITVYLDYEVKFTGWKWPKITLHMVKHRV